ncbi:MAG: baseplate J/gp47 family protein [Deltaproteobacteria bacterium]|nr:baseplate J/gp47 family protein [Deltaproteobacteria bacterium]
MFRRDTLRDIIARVRGDLEAAFGQYPIPRTIEETLAKLTGGLAHGLYGHLQFQIVQMLIDQCEDDVMVRWARIKGLRARPGSKATGTATFAAAANDTIPAGTIGKVGAIGFEVLSSTSMGGTCTAVLQALDTGSEANLGTASEIRLQSPVAGVESTGLLASPGTASGTDPESLDQLRDRLLYRYAHPPRGGAEGDFVSWALEVPGVLRAWEYPARTSPRTVDLLFVDENETDPLLVTIPSAFRRLEVQNYLNTKAPSTMTVDVIAPTAQAVAFEVELLVDTGPEAEVITELKRLMRDDMAPGGNLVLSQIRHAVSRAPGEIDHDISTPSSFPVSSASNNHLLTYDSTSFI